MKGVVIDGGPDAGWEATFSEDGIYRYRLDRLYGETMLGEDPASSAALPLILWIMMNPSTADAWKDDPTVAKCGRYSRAWGFRRLAVVNVHAFRATDPRELLDVADPVGPENEAVILAAAAAASLIVCAWGTAPGGTRRGLESRPRRVVRMLLDAGAGSRLHYLRVTRHPHHPLYLPGDLRPIQWTTAQIYAGHR